MPFAAHAESTGEENHPTAVSTLRIGVLGESQAAFFKLQSGAFQFLYNHRFLRKHRRIFCSEHFVGQVVEGISSFGCALSRAEDETHRRIFSFLQPVLAGIIQIKVHLSGVGIDEFIYTDANIKRMSSERSWNRTRTTSHQAQQSIPHLAVVIAPLGAQM